uniref:eukaryotic translation initiation factor 4E-1A-like isoform X1 n=1 Tax=Gasterosteus aculeatus aculeatus TaxID=481459 RepID=UPI001A987D9B|nr:eukaryotic translation initiation factor 4E-1A-like isoform X1 [Gasterosteus aculeatus aculeatus]
MATALLLSTSLPANPEKETCETIIQKIMSPESCIKHPLQNKWALWFFKNDKSKTWQANLRLISKFDTVEDFWALYNHIQLSSNLMSGCDYSLFKDGIEPMWEDARNRRGGRWLITLSKQQRRADLDRFWLETVRSVLRRYCFVRGPRDAVLSRWVTPWVKCPDRAPVDSLNRCPLFPQLLCLVGEAFDDHSDDVCGAVINVRAKGDKIAVWTTEYENKEAITHIGRVYKERLGVPQKVIIGYQSHADTATKSGSTTKNKFVA